MNDLLVLCSLTTGNLWRFYPGGSVCLIESEAMLRNAQEVADLEPCEKDLAAFAFEGDYFERIAYVPCRHCDESHMENGLGWFAWDENWGWLVHSCCEHDKKPKSRTLLRLKEGRWPCCHCSGTGLDWSYTQEIVHRSALPWEAVA